MSDTTLIDAAGAGAASPRVLPIATTHNLRDMGGYRTGDGRAVKWRHLYRSGVMARISDADRAKLHELGIVVICDLRGNDERTRHPTEWHHGAEIDYWFRDYTLSLGNLHELAKRGALRPEATMEFIHETYRLLPYEQASSYRELFQRLTAGRLPLLFNCSAGKDRTGIAAALILTALGVPRETILEDYSLSDHAIERLTTMILNDPKYKAFASFPKEHFLPMMLADPSYLTIAFEEMEAKHGSVTGYLNEVLGVGTAEIGAMRAHLLEEAPPAA